VLALSTSERYDGKNVAAIREPRHGDCVIRLAHPIPLGQDFPTGTRLAFGWTVAATDNVRAPPSSPITVSPGATGVIFLVVALQA
jgi:hypothetical protein